MDLRNLYSEFSGFEYRRSMDLRGTRLNCKKKKLYGEKKSEAATAGVSRSKPHAFNVLISSKRGRPKRPLHMKEHKIVERRKPHFGLMFHVFCWTVRIGVHPWNG